MIINFRVRPGNKYKRIVPVEIVSSFQNMKAIDCGQRTVETDPTDPAGIVPSGSDMAFERLEVACLSIISQGIAWRSMKHKP